MEQAGDEPLEQLALGQHDLRLVAHPLRHVVEAGRRLAHADQADQQARAAREEDAADRERGRQGECSRRDGYGAFTFRSSAVIAGTISVRSPITA